ncbi:MAG TPA: penicillin acylase family protein [Spirochaetota bacterium]|nr:penicillin acylase family protein [Spirochaetota bacterium]
MKKLLIVIALVIILVIAGAYCFLRNGLPNYTSDITAPGLSHPVNVERNRYAVPTVTARTMEDLFFAWGFVNAQDRMFQMEFTRRVGQGRISEFAGEKELSKDIFLRGVGFNERAKDYAKKLDPRFRALNQRYVDGVNYYLDKNGPNAYMKLLGMKKEKWEISDSALVGMMLNWSLAYNMKHELLYHRILKKLGTEKGSKLLGLIPAGTPTIVDDIASSRAGDAAFAIALKKLDWLLGCRSASNNWAVGPALTAHGGAILCTDMQVHQSKLPNDFYLIRVRAGDFEATGAQVVGLPFIASGYNKNCAWGLTNQGADMVDLFKETINWDKKTYRHGGKEIPLSERKEVFAIKGKDPVTKSIYYAGKKPILTEVFKDLGFDVSLDWTGFDAIDYRGFLQMNTAKNYEEFMRGAKAIRISPQNLAYADDRGTIAFRVIGSLPLREKGTGNLIQDGEKVHRNWKGNVPDDKYPMVKNPARGFLATANNKNVKDYPYELNGTYAPGYRYENIARMLRDKKGIDVEYMKKAQTDTRTVLARKIQDAVKKHVKIDAGDEAVKKARDLLLAWDGNSAVDSAGASIYNTFYVRLAYQTLADELGEEIATEYISERYVSMERLLDMVQNGSVFFDDVLTPEKEGIAEIATRAFGETCTLLAKHFGTAEPSKWAWGKMHVIRFDHVLGKSALFRPLVNYGPFPFEGDGETNNRARFSEVAPPFVADLASAPRIIVSFDPKPKAYMMLITGENEHFMSKHNTDMIDAWRRHEYFCMEEEAVIYAMKINPAAASK